MEETSNDANVKSNNKMFLCHIFSANILFSFFYFIRAYKSSIIAVFPTPYISYPLRSPLDYYMLINLALPMYDTLITSDVFPIYLEYLYNGFYSVVSGSNVLSEKCGSVV